MTTAAARPEELDEVCDLDMAQKQHILALFHMLGNVTYYTFLNVDPYSEKKVIKAAYYELASSIHPDKFFRKNLGSFRKKMEDVFARLTEAMEVLTSVERRKEYDDFLKMHGLLPTAAPPPRPSSGSIPSVHPQSGSGAPNRAPSVPSIRPAAGSNPGILPNPNHPASSVHRTAVELTPPTPEELAVRKAALARKLLGKRPSPSHPEPAEVTPTAPQRNNAEQAVAALRSRYEQSVNRAKEKDRNKHLDDANAFAAKEDYVMAKATLEHGLRAFPDHEGMKQRLREIETQAVPQLFAKYLSQAKDEEENNRNQEAARFYMRAADLKKDDHDTNFKAASMTYKHNGNLKEAAECAKRAVQVQPKSVKYRVLLGNIFLAAGLKASAKKEADVARELSPKDPEVAALLKRL